MLKELDAQVSVQQDRFNDTNTNKINQQANLNIVNSEIEKLKKNVYYNDLINNKLEIYKQHILSKNIAVKYHY